jgi:hypothetical protein
MKAQRRSAKVNSAVALAKRSDEVLDEIMNNFPKVPFGSMSNEERAAFNMLLEVLQNPELLLLIHFPRVRRNLTLNLAKIVAHDLKANQEAIRRAADRNDEKFFILLGKCLSGEITPDLFDKTDHDIGEILTHDPATTAKEAVRELKRRGHAINEEMFRMRKLRIIRNQSAALEALLATWRKYSKT